MTTLADVMLRSIHQRRDSVDSDDVDDDGDAVGELRPGDSPRGSENAFQRVRMV